MFVAIILIAGGLLGERSHQSSQPRGYRPHTFIHIICTALRLCYGFLYVPNPAKGVIMSSCPQASRRTSGPPKPLPSLLPSGPHTSAPMDDVDLEVPRTAPSAPRQSQRRRGASGTIPFDAPQRGRGCRSAPAPPRRWPRRRPHLYRRRPRTPGPILRSEQGWCRRSDLPRRHRR